MQLTLILADTFRQEVLKNEGKVLPKEQKLDIPLVELSPESRAIVAEMNPRLNQSLKLQIPRSLETSHGSQMTDDWEASFIPSGPQAWDRLFSAFVQAKEERARENQAYQQASLDEKLAELHKLAAKPEGPWYMSNLYFRPGKQYADCVGYEEALALMQELDERNKAYERQKEEQQRAKEQAVREAKERREQEKKEWIANHGSPSLQKKFIAGYEIQRQYVLEHAGKEFPGYVVDFDDEASWDTKFNPSDEAFAEAERIGGTVVWLTTPPVEKSAHEERESWGGDEEPFEKCEAVVIRKYLGSYDLVRQME